MDIPEEGLVLPFIVQIRTIPITYDRPRNSSPSTSCLSLCRVLEAHFILMDLTSLFIFSTEVCSINP